MFYGLKNNFESMVATKIAKLQYKIKFVEINRKKLSFFESNDFLII